MNSLKRNLSQLVIVATLYDINIKRIYDSARANTAGTGTPIIYSIRNEVGNFRHLKPLPASPEAVGRGRVAGARWSPSSIVARGVSNLTIDMFLQGNYDEVFSTV